MNYLHFRTKDNAEGQLNSGIGAGNLSIPLKSGEGAEFPVALTGAATSLGTSSTLNSTGIGATGIAVGDFIRNNTDGSFAYVLTVSANSITTTKLRGGSDNTWQNSDTYLTNPFIITLEKRVTSDTGVVTVTQLEKVLIKSRSGDTLTVETRGYDGTTANIFDADDYVALNVESRLQIEIMKAFANALDESDNRYTKIEVDTLIAARSWKDPVRVATTVAGTLASSFENGDTVDGIVLVTGDRILIKDQASALENGIYVVNASGAPTRATDFDTPAEVTGAAVSVTQGSSNADSIWICTSDNPTIGVSAINFAQIATTIVKATQAEADAGVDDTRYMTPNKTMVSRSKKAEVFYGTLGETFSASDITNNLNLAYQSLADMKWYKVTATAINWYNRLGIVLESGATNDSKLILLKGVYGASFSNINPTFSSALTGTDNNIADTSANVMRAILIANNTSGAEAIATQITIRVKKTGAPAANLNALLVLEQQEQANVPAAYWSSIDAPNGAIIGSAIFTAASITTSYQNLTQSLGGNIRIPAGAKIYAVFGTDSPPDASNYYAIESNAQSLAYSSATLTWTGTVNAGNANLTITSTSPVGYAVKVFTGSNGSFGLTPVNPWARCIGTVLSTSEFYFDPEHKMESLVFAGTTHISNNNALDLGHVTLTMGFCPSAVQVDLKFFTDANTDTAGVKKGFVRGDSFNASTFQVESFGPPTHWDGNTTTVFTGGTPIQLNFARGTQNKAYAVRLENGVHIFSGYPAGANTISEGDAGFNNRQIDILGVGKF